MSRAASGGFAAGIGGAGQTSSAQFLIATQVPGYSPIPTKINSNGTLTAAKLSAPPAPNTVNTPMAMNAAIDPSGNFLYEAVAPGIYGYTINRQTGDLTQIANFPVAPTQNVLPSYINKAGPISIDEASTKSTGVVPALTQVFVLGTYFSA